VGPDTTVFRVEGSQLLQVFSAYLGIDTTTTTTTGSCPAAMHYRRAVALRDRSEPANQCAPRWIPRQAAAARFLVIDRCFQSPQSS
jgi:hypothetical protein